jgi:hypothetical protein
MPEAANGIPRFHRHFPPLHIKRKNRENILTNLSIVCNDFYLNIQTISHLDTPAAAL